MGTILPLANVDYAIDLNDCSCVWPCERIPQHRSQGQAVVTEKRPGRRDQLDAS